MDDENEWIVGACRVHRALSMDLARRLGRTFDHGKRQSLPDGRARYGKSDKQNSSVVAVSPYLTYAPAR